MYSLKSKDQGLITLSQQDYLPLMVESFPIDRRSQSLSPETIELYTKKLQYFLKYCERQALTQISQLTSDFIRRYLLELSETHNPGGVHACFRPLRTCCIGSKRKRSCHPGGRIQFAGSKHQSYQPNQSNPFKSKKSINS